MQEVMRNKPFFLWGLIYRVALILIRFSTQHIKHTEGYRLKSKDLQLHQQLSNEIDIVCTGTACLEFTFDFH